jgi:FKBP-type peptidyl-prolyl cis-trans isomerase
MRYLLTALIAFLLFSCQDTPGSAGSSNTLPNGYKYTLHTQSTGAKPTAGQIVSLDFQLVTPEGEILDDSRNPDNVPSVKVPEVLDENAKRNPMLAMINLMSAGDSATVIVPVDSIPTLPPDYKKNPHIEYVIKVHQIEDEGAYKSRIQEEQVKKRAAFKFKEEAAKQEIEPLFADYMAGKLSSKTKTLENGLKITVLEEGTGALPVRGDAVGVQYYGLLKDGTNFDNSYKAGRPFTFTVGEGMVIQGWDLGLPQIKQGSKVFLEIPYNLAYGDAGNPVIPAKSDLIFHIELETINNK